MGRVARISLFKALGWAVAGAGLQFAAPAQAQDSPACGVAEPQGTRVALVIGNDSYRNPRWPQLLNAGRDAEQICRSLTGIGISTRVIRNADAEALRDSMDAFARSAAGARVVIVYFAGHGFEFAGRNYMVPVDAPASTRIETIERQFVSLEALAISAVPADAVGIFFVDACRTAEPVVRLDDAARSELPTLPVSALSIDQGAVFYSTARGRPALDQAPPGSEVSPFAAALVRHIGVPGIELAQLFRNVTRDVVTTTRGLENGPQWPQQQVNLLDSLFLVPPVDSPRRTRTGAVRGIDDRDAATVALDRLRIATGNADRHAGGGAAQTRGLARPLVLPPMARLAIEDEPQLISELLADHDALTLVQQAEAGDAAAQHLVGYMYAFGVGVTRNGIVARQWLERSAVAGYAPGQLEFGYFLLEYRPTPNELIMSDGRLHATPTPDDFALAESLYRAAARSGYAKAKTHLAQRIASGQFGPPDHVEARRLYEEAAAAGHGAAMFALVGYADLRETMLARLRAMAEAGNAEGDNWLCEAAAVDGTIAAAVADCEAAALAGYAGARALYARALADGIGVAVDRPAALHWARLARAQPELGDRARLIADIVAP